MNEFKMVEDLFDEPPAPTAQIVAEAHARMTESEGAAEPVRPARRVRRRSAPRPARRTTLLGLGFVISAATAAAALVGIGGVGGGPVSPPGSQARPTDLSARTILLSAAESTEKTPVGGGAYWMTHEQQGRVAVVGAAGARYVIEGRSQVKQWVGLGRRPSWQAEREVGARPQNRSDVAVWNKAGSPNRWNLPRPLKPWSTEGTAWKTTKLPVRLTFIHGSAEELRALPDDPTRLRAYLLRRKDDSEGRLSVPEWLYSSAYELLSFEPVPAKVRAAAYRMLADLPGIKAVGRTTDPLGRAGVAVALRGEVGGSGGAVTERRLVVNRSTGRLLAEEKVLIRPGTARPRVPGGLPPETVARPGTVLDYRAMLQATWTNSAP
jgi:hypothetical protein